MTHINQYSVTQKTLDKSLVSQGAILAGGVVKDFQGVMINYDFSPVCTSWLMLKTVCYVASFRSY
jgi:hypothetical protein